MSASGLGQRGKRVRDDQAALGAGQTETKQSRQAGVLQHLTNHEIWSIQEWANSEDKSEPMVFQRIANVTDFVDQLLDPEEVTKARKSPTSKTLGARCLHTRAPPRNLKGFTNLLTQMG